MAPTASEELRPRARRHSDHMRLRSSSSHSNHSGAGGNSGFQGFPMTLGASSSFLPTTQLFIGANRPSSTSSVKANDGERDDDDDDERGAGDDDDDDIGGYDYEVRL